jgi:hypothetical protein
MPTTQPSCFSSSWLLWVGLGKKKKKHPKLMNQPEVIGTEPELTETEVLGSYFGLNKQVT